MGIPKSLEFFGRKDREIRGEHAEEWLEVKGRLYEIGAVLQETSENRRL